MFQLSNQLQNETQLRTNRICVQKTSRDTRTSDFLRSATGSSLKCSEKTGPTTKTGSATEEKKQETKQTHIILHLDKRFYQTQAGEEITTLFELFPARWPVSVDDVTSSGEF